MSNTDNAKTTGAGAHTTSDHTNTSDPYKGKTVLVTGASSGIGEGLAREFASKGMKVVLTGRRKDKLDKVVHEIEQAGGTAFGVEMDVTSKSDVENGFKKAEEKFGPIEFTVANAGTAIAVKDLGDKSGLDEVEELIKVNVLGVLFTLHEAVNSARKCGGGVFIGISSGAAAVPVKTFSSGALPPCTQWTAYPASKAAVDALIRSSCGLSKENIRVYGVAPHVFRSEMLDKLTTDNKISADDFAAQRNPFIKKAGDPRDLAKVMLAIFDKTTQYPPGSVIVCDNYVTYDSSERLSRIYSENPTLPKSIVRDFQGKPYVWPNDDNSQKKDSHVIFTSQ